MSFVADLHIHSHFSRATSQDMCPENIWKWAQLKGVRVIGTGDSTHPGWLRELEEKLEPSGDGVYALREEFRPSGVPDSCRNDVSFLLSAEISCIYRKRGRTRKIHCLILAPDFEGVRRLNQRLSRIGKLEADGRPTLGMDAKDLLQTMLDSSPESLLIPAHAWTPHFSVFGAVSGFDSLEECFEDLTPHIHGIETGLSSDPPMNWRLSALDKITLLSNSDAHSPSKIAREASVFDTEISYPAIQQAIKSRRGFCGTIEFFSEEGKYYLDGHRKCGVRFSPVETRQNGFLCPVCGKPITVGVLHRVEGLADKKPGSIPDGAPSFKSVVPLAEIIAGTLHCGVQTKKVQEQYSGLLEQLGNELHILLEVPREEIEQASTPALGEAISRMRLGKVHIEPGYDGEYGSVEIL